MFSKRAHIFFAEESPSMKAHALCSAQPYSAFNKNGYVNLGTAENHLMDEVLTSKLSEVHLEKFPFHYDAPQGSAELRAAYSQFLSHFFKIKNMPLKNISVASGASALLEMLSFIFCDEGDQVLAIAPFYSGFIQDIQARFKAPLVSSHCLSEKGLDLRVLEKDIQQAVNLKVLLLNHPHNPTGYVLSQDEVREIIKLAKKYNLEIISDEIYGMSEYSGQGFVSLLNPAFADLDYENHIHHIYGIAKDFCMSGFKVGFFSSRNDQVARAVAYSCHFHTVSTYTQKVIVSMFQDLKWCEDFFNLNHRKIQAIASYLIPELKKLSIEVFPSEAGIFLWCDFSMKLQIKTFEQESEVYQKFFSEARINILPGQAFRAENPGWFRICFAQPQENIEEFLHRLKRVLQ